MNDLFEKIINNEIPSYKFYEDQEVIAILDINPHSKGHTLIIPKHHYVNILHEDDEKLKFLMKKIKIVSKILTSKLDCQGITVVINNGYGQEIKHLHIHLVPRYENDDLHFNKKYENANLEEILKKLQ